MESRNICKFVIDDQSNKLKITNFVYESDYDTMSNPTISDCNRAILIKKGSGVFHADDISYEYNAGCIVFSFENEAIYF